MRDKFKKGDYFVYRKDIPSRNKYAFVGLVLGLEPPAGYHYKIIRDFGDYFQRSFVFTVGSSIYDNAKIISEKEALIEVL